MNIIYLGIGSNIGDKKRNINICYKNIEKEIGHIFVRSSFYETEAWGFKSENKFINSCIGVQSILNPTAVLVLAKRIESSMGRIKLQNKGYEDRVIDIDILFYNSAIFYSKNLIIPHPLIEKRDFVLKPLNDIIPNFIHPILKKSISELYKKLSEKDI